MREILKKIPKKDLIILQQIGEVIEIKKSIDSIAVVCSTLVPIEINQLIRITEENEINYSIIPKDSKRLEIILILP